MYISENIKIRQNSKNWMGTTSSSFTSCCDTKTVTVIIYWCSIWQFISERYRFFNFSHYLIVFLHSYWRRSLNAGPRLAAALFTLNATLNLDHILCYCIKKQQYWKHILKGHFCCFLLLRDIKACWSLFKMLFSVDK